MLMTSAMPPAFIRHADTARARPEARRSAAPIPSTFHTKKQASPEKPKDAPPANTGSISNSCAVTAVCAAMKKLFAPPDAFPKPRAPLFTRCAARRSPDNSPVPPKDTKKAPMRGQPSMPLLKAVAAGAVLAVAGIAHMDGLQLAVAAVHIELALRNAARNAAVDHITVHISPPHKFNMRKSAKIIPNPVDKAPFLW